MVREARADWALERVAASNASGRLCEAAMEAEATGGGGPVGTMTTGASADGGGTSGARTGAGTPGGLRLWLA